MGPDEDKPRSRRSCVVHQSYRALPYVLTLYQAVGGGQCSCMEVAMQGPREKRGSRTSPKRCLRFIDRRSRGRVDDAPPYANDIKWDIAARPPRPSCVYIRYVPGPWWSHPSPRVGLSRPQNPLHCLQVSVFPCQNRLPLPRPDSDLASVAASRHGVTSDGSGSLGYGL